MFAVIKTGGKQYRVATDDVLKIEKLDADEGAMVEFTEVLMVGEGADATIGAPTVDGALVTAEVVENGRSRKVIAFKKRRRQNSKRKRGHRQHFTEVKIAEILTGGAKPSKKAAAKKAAPVKTEAAAETKADKTPASKKEDEAHAAGAPLFQAPEGEPDDLTNVKGIGKVAAGQLAEQGITTFAQLAALPDEDIAKVDEYMPFSAAQITDWKAQAADLAKS